MIPAQGGGSVQSVDMVDEARGMKLALGMRRKQEESKRSGCDGAERHRQQAYGLLACFLVGLLAGAVMLMEGRGQTIWLTAMGGAALSAMTLYGMLNIAWLALLRRRMAAMGSPPMGWTAMKDLRRADLLLIDDPMLLRRSGRCLAAHQANLDPRLAPLMLGLAKYGDHPLNIALANSLEGKGLAPEAVSNVDAQPSGQIRGEWRGHKVMLFVQPISYGDTKLTIHLHMDGEAAASVVFDEDIRSDAPPMLRALRQLGVVPVLYAPDSAQMLGPMARQLGLMAQGYMSEEDKDLAVGRHRAAGHMPLRLSLAAGVGQRALDSGGRHRSLLSGQDLAAIPTAISAARAHDAAQHRAITVIAATHILAFALWLSHWSVPVVAALAWGGSAAILWWAGRGDGRADRAEQVATSAAVKKSAAI